MFDIPKLETLITIGLLYSGVRRESFIIELLDVETIV